MVAALSGCKIWPDLKMNGGLFGYRREPEENAIYQPHVSEELCQLLVEASKPWSPTRHRLFVGQARQNVLRTLMLRAKLQESNYLLKLEWEIWLLIAEFVAERELHR
jgi:hypothetical protein